jgi:DNA (cytosine-5)-methyltransferase 1
MRDYINNSESSFARECQVGFFPENFKIPVSSNQAYRQFGNSVPVKVIEALGEQIIKYLKNYNTSKLPQSESKKIYY